MNLILYVGWRMHDSRYLMAEAKPFITAKEEDFIPYGYIVHNLECMIQNPEWI